MFAKAGERVNPAFGCALLQRSGTNAGALGFGGHATRDLRAVFADGTADHEGMRFAPRAGGLAEDEVGRADATFGQLHIALRQVRVIESGHGNFRVKGTPIVQHIG
jgi:hypothetical protein